MTAGVPTFSQVGVEECRVLLPLRGPAEHLGELDAADGGVQVSHAGVEADDLVLVLLLHALVAQQPELVLDAGVRRRDHAALAGGHVLRRVQAEHGEGAEAADLFAVEACSVRLGCVLDRAASPRSAASRPRPSTSKGWP